MCLSLELKPKGRRQRFGKELVQTKIEALDASIETSPRVWNLQESLRHLSELVPHGGGAETVHGSFQQETKTEQADRGFHPAKRSMARATRGARATSVHVGGRMTRYEMMELLEK